MADKHVVNLTRNKPSYIPISDPDANFTSTTDVKDFIVGDKDNTSLTFAAQVVHRKKARVIIRLKSNRSDDTRLSDIPSGTLSITLTDMAGPTNPLVVAVPVDYVPDPHACD